MPPIHIGTFEDVQTFCGIFAWNMLEYVVLWCSVSCVPLCKGVRCDRLCTLFSSRCFLTCLKCITLSCDCQQKLWISNYVSLPSLNTLLWRSLFCWVYLITRLCVCQGLLENFLKIVFVCLYVLLTLSILSHDSVIVNNKF